MTFQRIWHIYGAFLRGLGLIAGFATVAMAALVVSNVLSRYLFNTPVAGAFELSESLLVVIVFMSLALTQHADGHIRVILLTRRLPPYLARITHIFTLVIGAAFFAWGSYAAWGFAMESYAINEQRWSSISYPLYPVKFVLFFGLVLLSVQYVLSALKEVYRDQFESDLSEETD